MGSPVKPQPAFAELEALLGDRFATSPSIREHHGRDESPLSPAVPDAVAFPISTEEIAALLHVCNEHRTPVVPFGSGTSLEGHVLAVTGGVSLDLSRMDRVIAVRVDDLDVTVEAGVRRSVLNETLAKEGLFFPVDPGADATLGGMAATGASGTTTVRYGAMRENVLGMQVVLADGRVVRTAHRARKSSAGYDLTRLMVGSEGTLGVITELTLRAYGIPEAISAAISRFPTVGDAVRTAIAVLQLGIPVARIELVDELAIRAINVHSGLDYPAAPLLLFEFHGSADGVTEQAAAVGALAAEHSGEGYSTALEPEDRAELWRARHGSFYASMALRPGSRSLTTDVCVPISRLAQCIEETQRDIKDLSLTASIVGHVGDGNFHVQALIDPSDNDEVARAEKMNHRLVERALEMDGTCTGEHGIGLRKISFLERELPAGVHVMRQIKRTLDPNNILNPGKVLDLQM